MHASLHIRTPRLDDSSTDARRFGGASGAMHGAEPSSAARAVGASAERVPCAAPIEPKPSAVAPPVSAPARRRDPISLRTPEEIELMHSAGQVVRAALRAAARACEPGASTASVDAAAAGVIAAFRAEPLFLNHRMHGDGPAFPASTCVSVEEQLVHGIPGPRRLSAGEIVSIDCGVRLRGWCADAAVTVIVGGDSAADAQRVALVNATEQLLADAIGAMGPGVAWSEIADRMERGANRGGYGIVTDYMGHGIGRDLHEPPLAPNAVTPGFREHDDFTLRPGLVLAVEPMLVLGAAPVNTRTLDDAWTVVVSDGRPACHVEHTVAVTHSGVRVLTGPLHPSIREERAFIR